MSAASSTAVVLSGGSSFGAFGIGVMKVLFAGRSPATQYQPLEADIFSGTSVGAFNAAGMLCRPNESNLAAAFRLEKIWLDRVAKGPGDCKNGIFRLRVNPLSYLDADCLRRPALLANYFVSDVLSLGRYFISRSANFFASSDELDTRVVQAVNLASFVDNQPFHALLKEVIDEDAIRQNPKRLTISATNWVTGRVFNFTNADFQGQRGVLAVLASAAIPGIFPPVFIGNDQFVDGGAAENTPLNPAIELGATELHVIDLNPPTQFIPISAEANSAETLLRVYYVLLATKVQEDIETVAWINAGLRALERLQQTGRLSASEEKDFARGVGHILERPDRPYRKIRVHHYFPRAALGGNLDMLDFDIDAIRQIIALGETEALTHNCAESGCVT